MNSPSINHLLKSLFTNATSKNYNQNENILTPEQNSDKLFYISTGQIRQYYIDNNGKETTIHLYGPTSIIPLAQVLSSSYNIYYFQAISPTRLLVSPSQKIINSLIKNPELTYYLLGRYAHALTGMALRLSKQTSASVRSKILNLLKYFVHSYGIRVTGGVLIDLDLSHQTLADWIGSSRESVSRCLITLQKEGKIKYTRKKITVINTS